ncbi:MAG: FRG domain-containing protein, partial [Candidatus Lokiarchaeota archaeon]
MSVMEPYYNVIEINDKKALKRTLFSIGSNHSYVYRGQEDSNWTLKPSLERNIEFFNLENTRIRDYENNVIQKTESDCPNLNPIERIAKVQHYGGATRLIDFTREYAHALFFAFYNYPESDYASVWIISTENLPYIDRYILEEREGDLSLFEIDFQRNLEREKVFHFFIDEFQYSEEVNLDKFLENKMENYPGEMKQYKIAALDLIRNKQNEYEFNYQNNSGIKFFKPGEENPRDREVNEKLEEYFEKNFRLFKQKGLLLFSSDIGNSFE